jgi:phage tail-like protein
MAREPLLDWLQAFPFWLMDVAPVEALALPIFTPLSGFATIVAPEITVELQDIKEGNWHFKRHSVKSADVSQMTLTRGVTFADSDFWRWIIASITGDTEWQLKLPFLGPRRVGGPTPRRQLVLIQYFARNPFGNMPFAAAAIAAGVAAGVSAQIVASGGGLAIAGTAAGAAVGAAASAITGGSPIDFVGRVPARAWVLHGCLPVRYKAGSDFDAKSGEVSIAELDLKPELIEEISLTS